MKHHDLGGSNFPRVISGVTKLATTQLLPIPIRQPISIPKRRANISSVVGMRSLLLRLARKNCPIHHRTIRHHLPDSRIKRSKKSRRSAETPPNHKLFPRGHAKALRKRQRAKLFRKSANHIENTRVRRSFQKSPATLPSPAIARRSEE